MDLLKEADVIVVKEGLIAERVSVSQANIFVNDRLYTIHDDELRDLADEIYDRTKGSVTVFLSGFTRGCIVLVWNLTRAMRTDDLAGAVAYLCRCIARTYIADTW